VEGRRDRPKQTFGGSDVFHSVPFTGVRIYFTGTVTFFTRDEEREQDFDRCVWNAHYLPPVKRYLGLKSVPRLMNTTCIMQGRSDRFA
jgi:hypothetical protein